MSVGLDQQRLTGSVFGWRAWINHSSQRVILVHAGLGHEANPSVRSILEHTLAMRWMAEAGDAAMAATAAHASKNRRLLFDTVQRAGWTIPDGVARPDPTKHPDEGEVKNFEELRLAYSAGTAMPPTECRRPCSPSLNRQIARRLNRINRASISRFGSSRSDHRPTPDRTTAERSNHPSPNLYLP